MAERIPSPPTRWLKAELEDGCRSKISGGRTSSSAWSTGWTVARSARWSSTSRNDGLEEKRSRDRETDRILAGAIGGGVGSARDHLLGGSGDRRPSELNDERRLFRHAPLHR